MGDGGWELLIVNCALLIEHWRLEVGGWGMGDGGWELLIGAGVRVRVRLLILHSKFYIVN